MPEVFATAHGYIIATHNTSAQTYTAKVNAAARQGCALHSITSASLDRLAADPAITTYRTAKSAERTAKNAERTTETDERDRAQAIAAYRYTIAGRAAAIAAGLPPATIKIDARADADADAHADAQPAKPRTTAGALAARLAAVYNRR